MDGLADRGGPVGLQAQLVLGLVVGEAGAAAVRLQAHRLDANVRSPPAGPLAQFTAHVGGRIVDRLGAGVLLGHGKPPGGSGR